MWLPKDQQQLKSTSKLFDEFMFFTATFWPIYLQLSFKRFLYRTDDSFEKYQYMLQNPKDSFIFYHFYSLSMIGVACVIFFLKNRRIQAETSPKTSLGK